MPERSNSEHCTDDGRYSEDCYDSDADYEDEDEETLRARIMENPKNHLAVHCLGTLLMEQNNAPGDETSLEGEKLLRLATKLAPEALGYHYELAHALFDRNELQGALSAIRKEIALRCEDNEEMSGNHALLSDILAEKGDIKGAVEAMAKAAALDPGYPEHMETLGELRERLRESDSGGRVANVVTTGTILNGILRHKPLSGADKGKLADLLSNVDKWSQHASSDLAHVLANGGNLDRFSLNYTLLNGFDVHTSKTLALHFVSQAPESWDAFLSELANYYYQLAELAEALYQKPKPVRARIKATWSQSGRPTTDVLKSQRKELLKFADFWNGLIGACTPEGGPYDAYDLFPPGLLDLLYIIELFGDTCGFEHI